MKQDNYSTNILDSLKDINLICSDHLDHMKDIASRIPDAIPNQFAVETLMSKEQYQARIYFETIHKEAPPDFLTCHPDEHGLCGSLPEILDYFYREWSIQDSFLDRLLGSVGYRMNYDNKSDYIVNDFFFKFSSISELTEYEENPFDTLSFVKEIYHLIVQKELPHLNSQTLKDFFVTLYAHKGSFIKMKLIDLCIQKKPRFFFTLQNWDDIFEVLSTIQWPGDYQMLRNFDSKLSSLFNKWIFEIEITDSVQPYLGIKGMFPKENELSTKLESVISTSLESDFLSDGDRRIFDKKAQSLLDDRFLMKNIKDKIEYMKFDMSEEFETRIRLLFDIPDNCR
ncbi:MAG: hypothetical protein ACEPOV_10720 [Hyphomicrobiales bacterium]